MSLSSALTVRLSSSRKFSFSCSIALFSACSRRTSAKYVFFSTSSSVRRVTFVSVRRSAISFWILSFSASRALMRFFMTCTSLDDAPTFVNSVPPLTLKSCSFSSSTLLSSFCSRIDSANICLRSSVISVNWRCRPVMRSIIVSLSNPPIVFCAVRRFRGDAGSLPAPSHAAFGFCSAPYFCCRPAVDGRLLAPALGPAVDGRTSLA